MTRYVCPALLVLSCCAKSAVPLDEPEPPPPGTPEVIVGDQSIAFGSVAVRGEATRALVIENRGDASAEVQLTLGTNVRECSTEGRDPATFCVLSVDLQRDRNGRFRLAAGGTATVDLAFRPRTPARERGELTISGCASCPVQKVLLDGVGVGAALRCSPGELAFGTVRPGTCKNLALECESVLSDRIVVEEIIAEPLGGPFQLPEAAVEVPFEPGEARSIAVQFCPDEVRDFSGQVRLQIRHPDTAHRRLAVLASGRGGGGDVEVEPAMVDFGEVSTIAPVRRIVRVRNIGPDDLEITSVTAEPEDFTVAPVAEVVRPGDHLDLAIEAQPRVASSVIGTLRIETNDSAEPALRVPLRAQGVVLAPCNFELSPPDLIDLGAIERGRSRRHAVELRNTGATECLLNSAELIGNGVFTREGPPIAPVRIPPGGVVLLPVRFDAADRSAMGWYQLMISSPDTPYAAVIFNATPVDASVNVEPAEVDFGPSAASCSRRQQVLRVVNPLSSAAVVHDIRLVPDDHPAFALGVLPALPLTLEPGSRSLTLAVEHTPLGVPAAAAVELEVTVAGRRERVVVPLQAAARGAPHVEQPRAGPAAKVDLLLVIDDSNTGFQPQIGPSIGALVEYARDTGIDYHFGVLTTDASGTGRLLRPLSGTEWPRVVTTRTPNPEQALSALTQVGGSGSGLEEALHSAWLGMSGPDRNGHNSGFLRPDAALAILAISDELDFSRLDSDVYLEFFRSLKNPRSPREFSFSAIAGDVSGVCMGPFGSAAATTPEALEMIQRSGGTLASICTSDWSGTFSGEAPAFFGGGLRFVLQHPPVLSTLRVFVDGAELPMTGPQGPAWSFDPGSRSIDFTPVLAPEPGSDLRVEYTIDCAP